MGATLPHHENALQRQVLEIVLSNNKTGTLVPVLLFLLIFFWFLYFFLPIHAFCHMRRVLPANNTSIRALALLCTSPM